MRFRNASEHCSFIREMKKETKKVVKSTDHDCLNQGGKKAKIWLQKSYRLTPRTIFV